MKIFGPVTVKHDSTTLGDTFGGVSLNLITAERSPLVTYYNVEELVIGGEGIINFYSWPSTIAITDNLQVYDFGVVTLTGTNMTITLWKCKIMLDKESFELGTNDQKPIKMKLIFAADASGKVMTIS